MEQKEQHLVLPLPDLLPGSECGSEYKTDDPDYWRFANILGMAISIVVHAHKDNIPKPQRQAWFELWQKECKKIEQYKVRGYELMRHYHNDTYPEVDFDFDMLHLDLIRDWLESSLFSEPGWSNLYPFISSEVKPSECCINKWWLKLKDICRPVQISTESLDPIARILKISAAYN